MQMGKETGYVFLSNSRTAALEKDGEIVWFPCPRFDSPSIFSKILDEKSGGSLSLRPEIKYDVTTSYAGDGLIAKSVFSTDRGRLVAIDFMPLAMPAIIRMIDSEVPFSVTINPRFVYGNVGADIAIKPGGISFREHGMEGSLDVKINGNYKYVGNGAFQFGRGKVSLLCLYSKNFKYGLFGAAGNVYPEPKEALDRTQEYWKAQIAMARRAEIFVDEYKRSLAVIIGLTYAPSGAIIAAPTTSLPAMIGKSSNWDYRYVWIRDASYAVEALAKAGLVYRAQRALSFMAGTIDLSLKNFNHPLFELDGTAPAAERELKWLAGYRNSRPVRIGNGAYVQVQKDIEGEFLNALYTYFAVSKDTAFVKENMWAIDAIASWCSRTWNEKSTSLWEERGEKQHFVHTKLMNWVAIDRARRLKLAVGEGRDVKDLKEISEKIRSEIMKEGFSKKHGSFIKYYGSDSVDASLLLLPLYGFIDARDDRFVGTVDRIIERLGAGDGLLNRTENDYEGEDSEPFTLTNTWLARAYIRMGMRKKAIKSLGDLAKISTKLMLFGERVDHRTGSALGNFPQLFPHAGFVTAVAEYGNADLAQI